jgi:hypothetical protein
LSGSLFFIPPPLVEVMIDILFHFFFLLFILSDHKPSTT